MLAAFQAKKQEAINVKRIKDALRLPENKKCFDCPTKSPFFVNITLQTVVCARCSGLIREVGHRVKSISASTFTGPEAMALELGGNGIAAKIWLAGYNAQHSTPEPESDDDVRAFMRQKYFEQKWFDQELWHSQDEYIKRRIDECFTEDGELKPSARQQRRVSSGPSGAPLLKPLPSSPTSTSPLSTSPPIRRVPAPLNLQSGQTSPPAIKTAPLMTHQEAPISPQPDLASGRPSEDGSIYATSVPSSPVPTTNPASSIFADLAGLSLNEPPTASAHASRRATYTGGILTPTKAGQPRPSSIGYASGAVAAVLTPAMDNRPLQQYLHPPAPSTTVSSPHSFAPGIESTHTRTLSASHAAEDPYAALRGLHEPRQAHAPPKPQHDDDPYAALRQLNTQATVPTAFAYSNQRLPWKSVPKSPNMSESSDSLSWQGHSYTNSQDEWVEAEPFTPEDDDALTQVSSSTASSSVATRTQHDLFSDLDPLASYKRSKPHVASH